MDIKLKHRLVGACVILALAVFFLPMILDSEKYNQEIESKIPEQPSLDVKSHDGDEGSITINLDEDEAEKAIQKPAKVESNDQQERPEQQDNNTVNATDDKKAESQTSPEVTQTKSDDNDERDSSVAETKPKSSDSTTKQAADEVTKYAEKAPEKSKKEAVATDTSNEKTTETANKQSNGPEFAEKAWVIQIGSFSNKENATSLVAELRNKGFRAYQREATEYTRVFVGPYPDQAAANKRTEGLEKIVGAAVKVIEFDPQDH